MTRRRCCSLCVAGKDRPCFPSSGSAANPIRCVYPRNRKGFEQGSHPGAGEPAAAAVPPCEGVVRDVEEDWVFVDPRDDDAGHVERPRVEPRVADPRAIGAFLAWFPPGAGPLRRAFSRALRRRSGRCAAPPRGSQVGSRHRRASEASQVARTRGSARVLSTERPTVPSP